MCTVAETQTLRVVRLFILAAVAVALIVTEAELLFVGHTASNNGQVIAVVLVAAGLIVTTWHAVARNTPSIVVFRFAMYLFLVFGVDGILTHYHAAIQAVLKSQPALAGLPLLDAVLSGNIPLVAPGMLIQIGLLGLIYTFDNPLDARISKSIESLRLKD